MVDVVCPKCRRALPLHLANTGRSFYCGGCNQNVLLDVYPAAWRPVSGRQDHAPGNDAASCFFHDQRPAQAACDSCGRFLCALCDVPVGTQHLCPECLSVRNRHGEKQSLPNERVLWDRVALIMALLPVLLWPLTVITAPIALYLSIRYWRRSGGLVGRAWPRFLIASVLATAQIVAWTLFILGMTSIA